MGVGMSELLAVLIQGEAVLIGILAAWMLWGDV